MGAVIFDWGGTLTPWHDVDLRQFPRIRDGDEPGPLRPVPGGGPAAVREQAHARPARPQRRRDVTAAMAPKGGDDGLPPFPGTEDGAGAGEPAGTASDGLGESTAGDAFGGAPETPAKGGRRRAAQPAEPETV